MGGDYISIQEAARRSGLHPNTIQRLLREGRLSGFKANQDGHFRWWVSVRSVERYTNPWNGFLMDRPGPKLFLKRQNEDDPDDPKGPEDL